MIFSFFKTANIFRQLQNIFVSQGHRGVHQRGAERGGGGPGVYRDQGGHHPGAE